MTSRNSSMYSTLQGMVIGFHGCDVSTYNDLIINKKKMKPSNNDYDWLGNGMYFWEYNLER